MDVLLQMLTFEQLLMLFMFTPLYVEQLCVCVHHVCLFTAVVQTTLFGSCKVRPLLMQRRKSRAKQHIRFPVNQITCVQYRACTKTEVATKNWEEPHWIWYVRRILPAEPCLWKAKMRPCGSQIGLPLLHIYTLKSHPHTPQMVSMARGTKGRGQFACFGLETLKNIATPGYFVGGFDTPVQNTWDRHHKLLSRSTCVDWTVKWSLHTLKHCESKNKFI